MNKRWEFRKPWCSAGLYLSDCACWSVLLIPAIRAELQPASASQKHRSSTGLPLLRPVPRAKYTKNKARTSHLLLSRTKGQVVIFSVTPVLVKSGKMKVKHCAKCVTEWTGYLELISFVFQFHYYCCALWALLGGGSQPWSGLGSHVLGVVRAEELIHLELLRLSPHTRWCRTIAPPFSQVENGHRLNNLPTFGLAVARS